MVLVGIAHIGIIGKRFAECCIKPVEFYEVDLKWAQLECNVVLAGAGVPIAYGKDVSGVLWPVLMVGRHVNLRSWDGRASEHLVGKAEEARETHPCRNTIFGGPGIVVEFELEIAVES